MKTTQLITVAVVAWGALACEGSPAGLSDHKTAPALTDARTTDGSLALSNLGSQIDALSELVSRRPGWFDARSQLVKLMLARIQFTGRFSDFDRADALTEEALALEDGSARALRLRASFLSSVHRFEEALSMLDRAEAIDGRPELEARRSIALAVGAVERAEPRGDDSRSFKGQTALAGYLAAIGRYEKAAQAYRSSLAAYRDVSPCPVAWVGFQLGVVLAEEANAPERALPLYSEAIERLPGYVVARVHAAELLWRKGAVDEAVALLSEIIDETEDPEPRGLLGEILVAEGRDTQRATRLIADAKERYEVLLAAHREAFLDHASEFFAGPGRDPHRALELAEENLSLRQNPRAFRVAIEAAVAAEDTGRLCELLLGAKRFEARSLTLSRLVLRVSQRCSS